MYTAAAAAASKQAARELFIAHSSSRALRRAASIRFYFLVQWCGLVYTMPILTVDGVM